MNAPTVEEPDTEAPAKEKPDVWTTTANRVARRKLHYAVGDPKPNRSRIRRRIHRIKVQHGLWR